MLDLAQKNFKATVINMFKELKEATFEELKEYMMTMTLHIENINKDIQIIKKKCMKILELKGTTTEMNNSLKGLNSRFELITESRSSETL